MEAVASCRAVAPAAPARASWELLPPLPAGWALEVKIAEWVFNPPLSRGEPQLFLQVEAGVGFRGM